MFLHFALLEELFDPRKLLKVLTSGFTVDLLRQYGADVLQHVLMAILKLQVKWVCVGTGVTVLMDSASLVTQYALVQNSVFQRVLSCFHVGPRLWQYVVPSWMRRFLCLGSSGGSRHDQVLNDYNSLFVKKGFFYGVFVTDLVTDAATAAVALLADLKEVEVTLRVSLSLHSSSGLTGASTRWLLFRDHLFALTYRLTSWAGVYSAKVIGARIGWLAARGNYGSTRTFLFSQALMLVALPFIHRGAEAVTEKVRAFVDGKRPLSSAEVLEEERVAHERQQEEDEEANIRTNYSGATGAGGDAASSSQQQTNLYAILGVGEGSSSDEIRKAYKKLSLRYHPDRVEPANQRAAQECMAQINEAYGVLHDSHKRSVYDSSRLELGEPGIPQFLLDFLVTLQKWPPMVRVATSAGILVSATSCLLMTVHTQVFNEFRRLTSPGCYRYTTRVRG